MAVFNCKSCGGDLEISEGTTVVTCEYCGRQQTVPSADNEKKVNLFNRANRLRCKCEFDKAAGVYESIVAEFPTESEAYWGLCLCKFGIEYVDDPATSAKIPTCHRTSYESIFDDSNFDLACENADALAVNVYRDEAKEIDRLQKEILAIAKNEQPFDIFICYKESDELGGRTVDSELAHDIYDVLTENGYKVFYSRITLKAKLGQDYEPYIFSALNSAKVMLAVGTKFDYFNAVWVKNEWSRFLALMKKDPTKKLIPCYRGIDAYDLPKEFGNLQGQDLSSPRAFQDLMTNIGRIIPKQKAAAAVSTVSDPALENILKRAYISLEDGDWDTANKMCEKILDSDAENAQAYLVKLCIDYKLRKPSELGGLDAPIDGNNNNYQKVLRFGDKALTEEIEGYRNQILERIDTEKRDKLLQKCNENYDSLVKQFEQGGSISHYRDLLEEFEEIAIYKDAKEYAEKCREKIYDKAKHAYDAKNFDQAKQGFKAIPGYKDVDEFAKELGIVYDAADEDKYIIRRDTGTSNDTSRKSAAENSYVSSESLKQSAAIDILTRSVSEHSENEHAQKSNKGIIITVVLSLVAVFVVGIVVVKNIPKSDNLSSGGSSYSSSRSSRSSSLKSSSYTPSVYSEPAPEPEPKYDITEIRTLFNTPLSTIKSKSVEIQAVGPSGSEYSMYYLAGNGNYYYIDIDNRYHSDGELPRVLTVPIEMLIPDKSYYTLTELKEIFGDKMSVQYYPPNEFTDASFDVDVKIDGLNISLSTDNGGLWGVPSTDEPFTTCYLVRND